MITDFYFISSSNKQTNKQSKYATVSHDRIFIPNWNPGRNLKTCMGSRKKLSLFLWCCYRFFFVLFVCLFLSIIFLFLFFIWGGGCGGSGGGGGVAEG